MLGEHRILSLYLSSFNTFNKKILNTVTIILYALNMLKSVFSTIDARSCDSGPCQNGATCTNRLGFYTCTCNSGWTGKNCETGKLFQEYLPLEM